MVPIGPAEPAPAEPAPPGRHRATAAPEAPPRPASVPAARRPVIPVPVSVPMALGGRFASAAGALLCVGALAGTERADDLALAQAGDGAWWVTLTVEADLGRAAIEAGRGQPFLLSDGRYRPDRGFGAARPGPDDAAVDPAVLAPRGLLDLIRRAGLRPARPRPLPAVSIVLPGSEAPHATGRALDLGLRVRQRQVRLHPLPGAGRLDGPAGSRLMTRLDVEAVDGDIPATLLAAVEQLPVTLVARPAGPDAAVLIQHGLASPLADFHLAALAAGQAWILADAAFGCWAAADVGPPQPCTDLFAAADGYALTSPEPGPDWPAGPPARVTLVASRDRGQPIDALLVEEADREALTLLLEGHPLADRAEIVLGGDRHLVLAPGGLLDSLVVGQALTCVGPGLLYIPRGLRFRPRLPPSARQRLYQPDAEHAVVALEDGGLRFALSARRPVWALWVPPAVEVTDEFPGDTARALLALIPAPPDERPPGPSETGAGRPGHAASRAELENEARAAEDAGEFERAAMIHQRLGHPLLAGNLFERAAALREP